MKPKRRVKFVKVYDGDWVQPVRKGYLMKCCDCGLVHRLDFRIAEGRRGKRIQFRAFRLPKRT